MPRRLAPILVFVGLAACSKTTGVLLTIDGQGISADQLRIVAITATRNDSRLAPATPKAQPLSWPQSLVATFAVDAPIDTTLHVDALLNGAQVAGVDSLPIHVVPGRLVEAEVSFAAPAPMSPPDAAANDLGTHDLAPQRPSYAETVLADSPVAYWRLDDAGSTALDASGHGLNGTYGSQVTHVAPGLVGGDKTAPQFPGGSPGSSQAVVVQQSALLQPATSLTVELWISQASVNPDYAELVAYDGGVANNPPYDVFIAKNKINFGLGNVVLAGATLLTSNVAHHVVVTTDDTTMSIWLDGVLDATQPVSGLINYPSSSYLLGIGSPVSNAAAAFSGRIAEVAIFTLALGPARIAAHFQAAH